MEYGLKRIEEGFPLSLRLIREIHEVLLAKGRGHSKQPGEFRQSQNWKFFYFAIGPSMAHLENCQNYMLT